MDIGPESKQGLWPHTRRLKKLYILTCCAVLLLVTLLYLCDSGSHSSWSPAASVRSKLLSTSSTSAPSTACSPYARITNATRLFMDHIYCIGMHDNRARQGRLKQIFKYLDLDVEMFPAVDIDNEPGLTLPTDLAQAVPATSHPSGRPSSRFRVIPPFNKHDIGCWVSHLRVWQDMVEHGYETTLILEDDVDMDVDIHMFVRRTLDKLADRPWDLLYIGHCSDFEQGNPP
ncbi:hypothetical protein EV182_002392, partial [Spiromyces aspiralis]